jgi:hypothetical protein
VTNLNRSTRRKPATVQLCPLQTPHAARTRTRAAALGSQRLTAELTTRPFKLPSGIFVINRGTPARHAQTEPPHKHAGEDAEWARRCNYMLSQSEAPTRTKPKVRSSWLVPYLPNQHWWEVRRRNSTSINVTVNCALVSYPSKVNWIEYLVKDASSLAGWDKSKTAFLRTINSTFSELSSFHPGG